MRIKMLLAAGALALGVLAETLLWNHRAGPGWLFFTLLTLLIALELRRLLERRAGAWVWLLWGAAGAFSLSLFLYDGTVVHALAPWLAAITLSLACYWSLAGPAPLEALGYADWMGRWADPVSIAVASGGGVRDLAGTRPAWGKLLQGLALSLPLLFLFGFLFLQADPNYSRQVVALTENLGPLTRIALFSLLLLGVLRHDMVRAGAGEVPATPWQGDPTVLGVPLACLNLLFASFLVTQAGYLFRATPHPDFSVAEYARRGFFELVTATLMVLALVLVTYALLHRRERAGGSLGLLALLIVQTFGLAGSAVHRMTLYIQSYGLTLTRTYVEMALLGICLTLLLVLAALVRRPALPWLTSRMFLLGLLMLAGAALTDVERLVAEVNVARARAGATIDLNYLGSLSADVLPAVDGATAEQVRAHLTPLDFRELNLSRLRASLTTGARK